MKANKIFSDKILDTINDLIVSKNCENIYEAVKFIESHFDKTEKPYLLNKMEQILVIRALSNGIREGIYDIVEVELAKNLQADLENNL